MIDVANITEIDFRDPRPGTMERLWKPRIVKLASSSTEFISSGKTFGFEVTSKQIRLKQLILWCSHQSYWYYVLDKAVYSDEDYNCVRDYIINDHVATFGRGSFLYWGRTPCHFPMMLARTFDFEAWYKGERTGPRKTKDEEEALSREAQRQTRKKNAGFIFTLERK